MTKGNSTINTAGLQCGPCATIDFGPLADKPHTPEQAYCDQINNVHYLGSNLYIWRDTLAPHN